MSNTQATLVRMANDIAKNFAIMGDLDAAKATADHIHQFWDPRMKAAIFKDGTGLGPVAQDAIDILRRGEEPEHMTRATESNPVDGGHLSDAG